MTQLTGTGPVTVAQGVFEESSSALHNLGELIHSNDGRAYRYCKAGGTALDAGKLQQTSAQDTGDQNLAMAAASAGDTSITTTGTVTVTANQYAGGFVIVADDAGEGHIYRIKDHAAATAAAVTLNLDDKVKVAMTTDTTIDLVKNPYDGVIVNPTTVSGVAVGVATFAVTASYYAWLQVKGPASVLADGALTVGTDVVASDNVAGAVEVTADGTPELLSVVGTAMTAAADTEYGAVYLRII